MAKDTIGTKHARQGANGVIFTITTAYKYH